MDINIEELIPHRPPMKLIDEVLEVDDEKAITASIVSENWPLYREGSVSPVVMIELVAQATGIATGWKRKRETGKGIKGYLVGIKEASFYIDRIPAGTRLITNIENLYKHETYGVFSGTVKSGSKLLGKVEIQAFREDKE
jgi:predicted hotdog family 3-hydroxylacyl-ACP dehydratase